MLSCVVDELGKCHNGDVGVRSLGNGLMGDPGVGDEEEPGLPEGGLRLVGEGAGGEPARDRRVADVPEQKQINRKTNTLNKSRERTWRT